MAASRGSIILVNGASSSGKSTLCAALQAQLPLPFWHYSIDHFRGTGVLPWSRIERGDFAWHTLRPAFFEGFHRCLPALAGAGNHLLVEHIVETRQWMARLVGLLGSFDVFFVGVHCPVAELERREAARGDRPRGDARRDFETVHEFCTYDIDVDSTDAPDANVAAVLRAWNARSRPNAFDRMLLQFPQSSA
jgi:chloramphenicol 3-O phosphotransferase